MGEGWKDTAFYRAIIIDEIAWVHLQITAKPAKAKKFA